jgi:hypothetical protein
MLTRPCAHEDATRRLVIEGRVNPALMAHIAACEPCRLTLELAGGLRDLAAQTTADNGESAPSASFLWWKAELLRQFDAQARVVEPVEIGERLGAGFALIGAGILLLWLWRQMDAWAGSADGMWAGLPWLTTAALAVCTLVLGTAAAVAVVNLGSWNRKE